MSSSRETTFSEVCVNCRVQEVDAYVASELQVLKEREHESLEDQQARLISIQDRQVLQYAAASPI